MIARYGRYYLTQIDVNAAKNDLEEGSQKEGDGTESDRGWVTQPIGRGNLAPTMDDAPQIVPHLAPEGRYVYRTRRHTPNTTKPQRGDM